MLLKLLLINLMLSVAIAFAQADQTPTTNPKHYYTDSLHIESSRKHTTYHTNEVTKTDLLIRQITSLRQLTTILPGLFTPDYGSQTSGGIYYRGLGNRYSGGGLAIYVDEAPGLPGTETSLTLTNIENVTLGQQTGFSTGPNELHLTTKNPTQNQTNIQLSYGNANTSQILFEHNNSHGDLFYGFTLDANYSDGFETNTYSNKHANNKTNYAATLKLNWQPTANIHSKTKFTYRHLNENSFPYRLLAEGILHNIAFNDKNTYQNNIFIANENLYLQITDNLNLTSITSYTYANDVTQLDQDFSQNDIFTLQQKQNRHQITEEVRLTYSKPSQTEHILGAAFVKGINSPLTANVLFKRHGIENLIESHVTANIPESIGLTYKILDSNFHIPNNFEDNKTELGLYYQASHNNMLVNGLSATAMLRANYNKAALDYNVTAALTQHYSMSRFGITLLDTIATNYAAKGSSAKDYFNVTPKLLLTYSFDANQQKVFGSFKYGVKNGGYNVQMLSDIAQTNLRAEMITKIKNSLQNKLLQAGMPADAINSMLQRIPTFATYNGNIGDMLWYNPEESLNYEMGWQSKFHPTSPFGNKTNINLSATLFYINVNNLQLTQFSPNGFGRMLTNAGSATSKGIEATAKLQPTDNLTFNFIYNFADARFAQYTDTARNNNNEYELVNYKNNRIPYTPNHTINISSTYITAIHQRDSANINLAAHLEYAAAANIFWNEANTMKQNYYDLWNAKVSLNYKQWTLELWAKNILNEKYYTFYFESLSKNFFQLSKPAQFGVNLKYSIEH